MQKKDTIEAKLLILVQMKDFSFENSFFPFFFRVSSSASMGVMHKVSYICH